ncbi:MAG: MBL fold metallo-hydrolase [Candidatus Methanomethylophilaceae archaeon]|nr:MBL fold metallo-hydrolase [Candidatus Methanomethylophilaceae archaeon]MDD3378720.1 MBL fold metallo-hydrolase [Candidatus Methanomethylophilaceae archaeon]
MFEVHVLASGSDGNCTVIEFDDEAVMIDAGISCRRIQGFMDQEGYDRKNLKALLITHEHSDHIAGAGATARKMDIPIYCNRPTYDASNFGNVRYNEIKTMNSFMIGGINITPLPTSHNAVEPNAFLVEEDGKKVLLATDTGVLTFQVEQALAESNIAVIESNYDKKMLAEGPYPIYLKKLIGSDHGHLSNVDCAFAIKRTMDERRKIFLAHLSKTNNTPDIAREAVSEITGIKRLNIDCLEFPGDTRTIRLKG